LEKSSEGGLRVWGRERGFIRDLPRPLGASVQNPRAADLRNRDGRHEENLTMNRISTTALLWTLGALSSNANGADTNPFADFKIKGQTYFDFEQPVTDDGPRTTGEFSSFDFRRGYLTNGDWVSVFLFKHNYLS